MAYPLSERPERKKKPEPNNKPFLTAEREAIEEGVAELVQWEPVQQALRTPVIRAIGGGLRTVMQGATEFGEYLKEEARQPIEGFEDIGPSLAGSALIGAETLIERTQRGFEMYATGAPIQNPITGESLGNVPNLNVDPAVARFAGGAAAETLLGAGASKAATALKNIPPAASPMQPVLAGSGGGLKLNFNRKPDVPEMPQVMPLTVTQPERIAEGVVEGIAKSPQFAPQVARWQKRWDVTRSRLDKWIASTESAKVKSRNIKKSRDARYGKVSTGMSRVDDLADEQFYETMPSLGKERHHLFPKAESYQFVKRLKQLIDDGVADMDDMVNLFLYAEDAGTVMGNRKANMLLMEKIQEHGPLHRMRETTEGALGLLMEPKTQDLYAKLLEATNADELMDMFDEYLKLNIKPSKRAAFEKTMKKEREFLNVMKPTLSESQRRRL